jgi:hypothetical protein
MGTFHMTVEMIIDHLSGPALDPAHVAAWLVEPRQALDIEFDQITFVVCPAHPDPGECDCPGGPEDSMYRAQIDSAA